MTIRCAVQPESALAILRCGVAIGLVNRRSQQPQPVRGAISQLACYVYQHSRFITVIALIAAVSMVIRHSLAVVGPMQSFHDQFMGPESSIAFVDMLSEDYYQDGMSWKEQGHLQILSDDPTKALLIIYAPGARWS